MAGHRSGNAVQLGAQGRVVIPAELRKALNWKPGDHLVLERREAVEQRLRDRFCSIPGEVGLVRELLEEREAVGGGTLMAGPKS